MKRSEMLNEMMSAIAIRYGAPLFPMDVQELMDVILKAQEKLGMLPPDYFIDGWDDMFDQPCKIRRRNSWEPEDEKK